MENCPMGVQNSERIKALENWQKRQNGELHEVKNCVNEIKAAIHKIDIELVRGRPTWIVTALLTTLFSLVTGLAVYLLTAVSVL